MATPLQIDFPMQGPRGDEMPEACRQPAELIAAIHAPVPDVTEQLSAVNRGPLR